MDFSPTDYVDISGVCETKKTAMFAHRTQNPEEIYASFFKAMEEFRGLEAGVSAVDAFIYFKPNDKRLLM